MFDFLKNKWNSLIDFINKTFNIGEKWKLTDNDNPKNPKSPKVSMTNTAKGQSWMSKKWDSFKGVIQNSYGWTSQKVEDLKDYASKKYQDIKNFKLGKIISVGYDKLKSFSFHLIKLLYESFFLFIFLFSSLALRTSAATTPDRSVIAITLGITIN